jgi:hypothetical protein
MSEEGSAFRPEFEGEVFLGRLPADLFERLERRIADGLWVAGRRSRANYRIITSSREGLTFEAADFSTAYSVGLNEVKLWRSGPATIGYEVRFSRWARYARIHAAVLGVALSVCYLLPGMRTHIATTLPGAITFWSLVMFWSLVWPWLLIALHRPFARRALEQVLRSETETGGHRQGAA